MRFVLTFLFLNSVLLSFSFSDSLTSSAIASKAGFKVFAEEDDSQTNLQIKQAQKAIWRIYKEDSFSAAAFSIGSNLFVTNFHVIDNLNKEGVILKQKDSSALKIRKVIAASVLYDLVLFETEERVTDYLTIIEVHSPQPDEGNLLEAIQSNHLNRLIEGSIGLDCSNFQLGNCISESIGNLLKSVERDDSFAQRRLGMMFYKMYSKTVK